MSVPPRIIQEDALLRAVLCNNAIILVEAKLTDAMGDPAWVRVHPGSEADSLGTLMISMYRESVRRVENAYREGWEDGVRLARAKPQMTAGAEEFDPCWDGSETKATLDRQGE